MSKIRPLEFTEEKLTMLALELQRADKLHTSDERLPVVWNDLSCIFDSHWDGYELGDFNGVLVFWGIIPGFKCTVMLVIWDNGFWGPDAAREGRAIFEDVQKRYGLRKMESESASVESTRLARMFGFEDEGIRFDSFKRGEKLYDVTLLGRTFGGENG